MGEGAGLDRRKATAESVHTCCPCAKLLDEMISGRQRRYVDAALRKDRVALRKELA